MTTAATLDPQIRAYDDLCNAFQWDVPEHYNFAVDAVGCWAADPTRLAMLHLGADGGERAITFAEFDRRSDRLASVLRQRGIGPGDRVLLVLPRLPEWYEAMLALMKLGAIALPGTTLLTARDLAYRFSVSGARGIIADATVAQRVDQIAGDCPALDLLVIVGESRPGWLEYEAALADAPDDFQPARTRSDDPLLIYFTSGTTAHPKMVLHSHAYPIGHQATAHLWRHTPDDAPIWALSDGGWAFAAYFFFGAWGHGKPLFIHDFRDRISPTSLLENLTRFPISAFAAPPTVYRMLILEDLAAFQPAALQIAISAGEPLNPEVIATWEARTGVPMLDVYGQTESVVLLGNFPPLPVRPGSAGKPSPGHTVAVIDDDGNELPVGEEGHIAVRLSPARPPGLFQGYYGEADLTAEMLGGDWYRTGDRARVDADGYFWFIGRSDDVIKSSGYRISPFEIESVLIEHPAVAESAVVASPHAVRGDIIKAFIILAPGHAASDELAQEIQTYVQQQTAPYKYPREIEFVTELPKTISGKIRRVELREREIARQASGN